MKKDFFLIALASTVLTLLLPTAARAKTQQSDLSLLNFGGAKLASQYFSAKPINDGQHGMQFMVPAFTSCNQNTQANQCWLYNLHAHRGGLFEWEHDVKRGYIPGSMKHYLIHVGYKGHEYNQCHVKIVGNNKSAAANNQHAYVSIQCPKGSRV